LVGLREELRTTKIQHNSTIHEPEERDKVKQLSKS